MGAPPNLTTQERRDALKAAVAARRSRAAFKEEIKVGKKSWKDAFSAQDESIKKMRVRELIESLPGVGGVGRSQYEKLLELMKVN